MCMCVGRWSETWIRSLTLILHVRLQFIILHSLTPFSSLVCICVQMKVCSNGCFDIRLHFHRLPHTWANYYWNSSPHHTASHTSNTASNTAPHRSTHGLLFGQHSICGGEHCYCASFHQQASLCNLPLRESCNNICHVNTCTESYTSYLSAVNYTVIYTPGRENM